MVKITNINLSTNVHLPTLAQARRVYRTFQCAKCKKGTITRHKVIAPRRDGKVGVMSWCLWCALEDIKTWHSTLLWERENK